MARRACLVVTVLGLCVGSHGATGLEMEGSADLNGDGQLERISVTNLPAGGGFTLTVAETSVEGRFSFDDEDADGFLVVDIDTTDRFKEVAVHSPGPSDDDEYLVYWYDGASLRESGRLARWPELPGHGFVYVDDWMDFWRRREKYRLDKQTHQLHRVPQELYYVGVDALVRESFPIHRTREATDLVGYLRPESQCLILVCDPSPEEPFQHWYLIKSVSGLVGWARYQDFWDKLELPLAD